MTLNTYSSISSHPLLALPLPQQVAHWCHELIEQEHQAKQTAHVLFYVIDNRTRNVVGIIEAANFAGSNRKLVLVVNPYNGPGDSINGESISDQ